MTLIIHNILTPQHQIIITIKYKIIENQFLAKGPMWLILLYRKFQGYTNNFSLKWQNLSALKY